MARVVRVTLNTSIGPETVSAPAEHFTAPVALDGGMVQVAPALTVAGSAFLFAEYLDEED